MTAEKKERTPRGFIWNSAVYLIPTVITSAATILILPITTRYLSPADYGIVALFAMFGNLVANVISTNLHFASYIYYFQFKKDLDRFKTLYSTNVLFMIAVFLFCGLVIYYSSSWISAFFFKGRLSPGLVFLSYLSGCFEYLILYMTTLLAAQVKSVQYSAIVVIRFIITMVFTFYFIFGQSLTYLALIYSLMLAQIIALAVLLLWVGELFALRFSLSDMKLSLKLAFPLVPNSMIGVIYSSFDKALLNNLRNTDAVGYYSFGERISLMLKTVMDAVSKSWEPYFMNKAHEHSAEAREAIIKRFYEIAFVFMIMGLGLIYFSEEVIKLLTTKPFYPSMYIVPLYIYSHLFGIIGSLAMNQIGFSKKMAYLLPTSIVMVLVNIVLNIILIQRYGAMGAAGALALSALTSNGMNLYFGMKLYPLPLGLWRLTSMYLILISFTLPIYLIMPMGNPLIVNVPLKLLMVLSFILIGVKMHYVSRSSLQHVFGKIKDTARNLAGI